METEVEFNRGIVINRNVILMIIIVLCLFAIGSFIYYQIRLDQLQKPQTQPNIIIQTPQTPIASPATPTPLVDMIKEHDYRNISDPLYEPTRRPQRYVMNGMIGNPHFNVPTRGYPDDFSWLGYAISNDDIKDGKRILKLMGRQEHPNSTWWNYYVIAQIGHQEYKFSLDEENSKHKELYDDDIIRVPELGNQTYKIKLNKNNVLSYNPYLI
jgi:hypothetical protein